jgi:hypothetical protein
LKIDEIDIMGADEGFDIYPVLNPTGQNLYNRFLGKNTAKSSKTSIQWLPLTGKTLIGEPRAESTNIYFQFGEGGNSVPMPIL